MWELGLWFLLLLLQWDVCTASEVNIMKTIGREAYVTPVCPNKTLDTIVFVVCKITTERHGGKECDLLYENHAGKPSINGSCDSRLSLLVENDTVFLHLQHLTPADNGNYTCECSSKEGTVFLHLGVSIEGYASSEKGGSVARISPTMIAIAAVITAGGIIFGIILKNLHHRRIHQKMNVLPPEEEPDIEPYSTFMQRENDLYSTSQVIYTLNPDINDDTRAKS